MRNWFQTYTGKAFYFTSFRPEDIDIRDIAHALSFQCRFNGHCKQFYSIAEHSIRVAEILPNRLTLSGLLHDAAEAYFFDVSSPLKELPIFDEYRKMLVQCEEVIMNKYGEGWPMDDEIKHADLVLRSTEKRDLMTPEPMSWGLLPEPLKEKIIPWDPEITERAFIRIFKQLTK